MTATALKDGPKLDHPDNNLKLRALVTLPPVQHSSSTSIAVPVMPPQGASVTGDKEVDAVLWLREVIRTGDPALIAKAMEAAKLIKTPLKALAERYQNYLVAKNPGNIFAALSSFGFENLAGLAKGVTERKARQHEAISIFGSMDEVFAKTPAEQFCINALAGLKRDKSFMYNEKTVAKRYKAIPEYMPVTLSDCLYELAYWDKLYWLRGAFENSGDHWPEVQARDDFVFTLMATIKPASKSEALAVFQYLKDRDRLEDDDETNGVLLNLIGGQS